MNAIDSAKAKLGRAEQHIAALRTEIAEFWKQKPYKIGVRVKPDNRPVYFIEEAAAFPVNIPLIIGDTLQNLRSALDHLAWGLVEANGAQPGKHTYFPIADDVGKYAAIAPSLLRGTSQKAIDLVDSLKPYGGGDNDLWRLHRLNNIDKHRFIVTVGAAYKSMNLADVMSKDVGRRLPDFFVDVADRLFPLKVGDELLIDVPNAKVADVHFQFAIYFGEAGLVEGLEVADTLITFLDAVARVVAACAPLL